MDAVYHLHGDANGGKNDQTCGSSSQNTSHFSVNFGMLGIPSTLYRARGDIQASATPFYIHFAIIYSLVFI